MAYHSGEYESEAEFRILARKSTNNLLAKLKRHHSEQDAAGIVLESKPTITRAFKAKVAEPKFDETENRPRVQDIKRAVIKYFRVLSTDLDSHRKFNEISYARQICMYLARTLTLASFPEIGRRLGGRDHTTILYGSDKISRLVKSDWMVAFDVAQVEAVITGDRPNE